MRRPRGAPRPARGIPTPSAFPAAAADARPSAPPSAAASRRWARPRRARDTATTTRRSPTRRAGCAAPATAPTRRGSRPRPAALPRRAHGARAPRRCRPPAAGRPLPQPRAPPGGSWSRAARRRWWATAPSPPGPVTVSAPASGRSRPAPPSARWHMPPNQPAMRSRREYESSVAAPPRERHGRRTGPQAATRAAPGRRTRRAATPHRRAAPPRRRTPRPRDRPCP